MLCNKQIISVTYCCMLQPHGTNNLSRNSGRWGATTEAPNTLLHVKQGFNVVLIPYPVSIFEENA